MNKISRMTIDQVRELLAADGFDPNLAGAVKRAAANGCLLWTTDKLVTTDSSRLHCFPHEPQELA